MFIVSISLSLLIYSSFVSLSLSTNNFCRTNIVTKRDRRSSRDLVVDDLKPSSSSSLSWSNEDEEKQNDNFSTTTHNENKVNNNNHTRNTSSSSSSPMSIKYKIFSIECTEDPIFLCMEKKKKQKKNNNNFDQQYENENHRHHHEYCHERITKQQNQIISEIQNIYMDSDIDVGHNKNNVTIISQTTKLTNMIFVKVPIITIPNNNKNNTSSTSSSSMSSSSSSHRSLKKKESNLFKNINGIKYIRNHYKHQLMLDETIKYIGSNNVNTIPSYGCLTGKGITIGVLDSGIDYTHKLVGGVGTTYAYEKAYGKSISSNKHTKRDKLFPTTTIIEGYDFLGDWSSVNNNEENDIYYPDDDPIDSINSGHGTLVASHILAVAPNTKLIAAKVCSSTSCPDFAIINGLEYVLDPYNQNTTNNKVDIINLSLGDKYLSSYDSPISATIEMIIKNYNIPIIVAGGNAQNYPYIIGSISSTINSISVASTNYYSTYNSNTASTSNTIAWYSSRGPGENNKIKPDIAAPSGSWGAKVGTGFDITQAYGTSFSTPIITGCIALIKEKYNNRSNNSSNNNNNISSFFIKSLLMNNAFRGILTKKSNNAQKEELVPITRIGSGEVRIDKALNATFWAYSPDNNDVQPSLSLGLIDASNDIVIKRTIKVINLLSSSSSTTTSTSTASSSITSSTTSSSISSNNNTTTNNNDNETLIVKSMFRDPNDEKLGAITIQIYPNEFNFTNKLCNEEIIINIEFHVHADKAPNNYAGYGDFSNPEYIKQNINEFDGYIIIESQSSKKDISLPFLMLLRKASDTTILSSSSDTTTSNDGITTLPYEKGIPTETILEITNNGAGPANIDSYDIIGLSDDMKEGKYGEKDPRPDFRSIGFRTVPANVNDDNNKSVDPQCTNILEFAINTWERHDHLGPYVITIRFDIDDVDGSGNGNKKTYELNHIPLIYHDLYVDHNNDEGMKCTGLSPDDSTNTANTVLRVCSNDVGVNSKSYFNVTFLITELPSETYKDFFGPVTLHMNKSTFSANSYDVKSGETLNNFIVKGSGHSFNKVPLGLMLITDAYRSIGNTGSSTKDTETHLLLVQDAEFFHDMEVTPDIPKKYPIAEDTTGPQCFDDLEDSDVRRPAVCLLPPTPSSNETPMPTITFNPSISPRPTFYVIPTSPTKKPTQYPTCTPVHVPRVSVPTHEPTNYPTMIPSTNPTKTPTTEPSYVPSTYPTLLPTITASVNPTSMSSEVPTSFPSITASPTSSASATTFIAMSMITIDVLLVTVLGSVALLIML